HAHPDVPQTWFAEAGALLRAGLREDARSRLVEGVAYLAETPWNAARRDLGLRPGHTRLGEGDHEAAAEVWVQGLHADPRDANLFLLFSDALGAATGDPWAALVATADMAGIEDNAMRRYLERLQQASGAADGRAMDELVQRALAADAER